MTKKKAEQHSKRVGIWIRVSTEEQAESDSPQHHEQRARWYAESNEWQVVEVYHLEGVSGKYVKDHPETLRMMEDVRKGRITGLIFSKLARLTRSVPFLLELSEFFQEYNADLISLQECIDTTTPVGRLFYTVSGALSQWEREEIAERVAASVPIRAKLGKPVGGKAPYGYQWEKDKLILQPEEVPVCRRIFEVFAECQRLKATARIMNESGYRSSRGANFCDSQIQRILTNPTYKGLHRSNYTRSRGENKNWVLKPESEWIYNQVEPIVSEELWDQCNKILIDRSQGRRKLGKRPVQLFAGVTFCKCGQKMYVPSNSPKYICQKCRNKIPIVDLEDIYYQQLQGFFLTPDDIELYLKEGDAILKEKEELLQSLQKEQIRIKQETDDLFQLYLSKNISKEGFGERNLPMEERLSQIRQEIPKLQGEIDYLKINLLSSDQVLHEAKDLYSRWPKLEFPEKRKIIEYITDSITVDIAEVTINFCYIPPSEYMAKKQHNHNNADTPGKKLGAQRNASP